MKTYKLKLLMVLAFFVFFKANAQKEIKYKEIYDYVLKTDTILSYEKLKMYQQLDPFHANSYYQLGLISQAWSKKYDPFTQPQDVRYFIYHTNVYFGLSKKYLDDKEARKNGEIYQAVSLQAGEKISLETILADIEKRLSENALFSQNFEKTYKNFIKSTTFYNQCVELFLEINRNNANEKELFLTISPEIRQKIEDLSQNYDSTLFYLDAFVKNLNYYPLKSYKPQYSINPIETYRLEGLTYSNFLQNNITLWDFKQWITNFNQISQSDIQKIRFQADSTHQSMMQIIEGFENQSHYSDTVAAIKINPKVLFKIGKFDYNSVLIDYFNYLETKANYLRFTRKTDNNVQNIASVDMRKKAYYYSKLYENKKITDSLALFAQNNVNEKSVSKYSSFVNTNFTSTDGFKTFFNTEKAENNTIFNESLQNYNDFLVSYKAKNQIDTVYTFGKHSIALKLEPQKAQLLENETKTECIKIRNKEIYLSGKVMLASKEKAFVCAIADKKVKWFKTFENNESSSNSGILVEPTANGCFLMLTSVEPDKCINRILQINANGQKTNEFLLLETAYPRYMRYDDINERILITYYGNTYQTTAKEPMELFISMYNTELKISSLWAKAATINMIGNFVDLVQINEDIYVFSNFHEYTNLNAQKMFVPEKVSQNQYNTLLTVINKEGNVTKMLPYFSNEHYTLTEVIKIDNNLINLLGAKDKNNDNESSKTDKPLKYMLINASGDLIFSN